MKSIFDCANRYVQSRDWKMLAFVKFCLCSMGVILGLLVPEKHKKAALGTALGVFLATYIPLMADYISFCAGYFRQNRENIVQ